MGVVEGDSSGGVIVGRIEEGRGWCRGDCKGVEV
jgi:hypothetical protein